MTLTQIMQALMQIVFGTRLSAQGVLPGGFGTANEDLFMSARNTFAATRRSHTILKWLKEGDSVTIDRVSDTFGVKYPQAREDLKLLEEIYDLTTAREGRTKVWRWSGGEDFSMSIATAAALELGGVALDIFRDTPHGEAIKDLTEACRERLSRQQYEQMGRLSDALHLRRTWLPVKAEEILEVVEDILDAIVLRHGLHITYERADGERRAYEILPRRLIWYTGRLWLQAQETGQHKLFDVAGISESQRVPWQSQELVQAGGGKDGKAVSPDEDAAWAASGDPGLYFKDSFGIYADNYPVEDVELTVSGSWANYLRRYRIHPSQQNVEESGGLRIYLRVGICPEFKSFLMGIIPDFEVEKPLELREELRLKSARWARKMAQLET